MHIKKVFSKKFVNYLLIKNIFIYICINIKTNIMTKKQLIDKIIKVYLIDGKNMFKELHKNKTKTTKIK